MLSLLRDRTFDKDTQLVSTVGVNIFRLELSVQGKRKKELVDIRELGGQLAPVWTDYIKRENSVIFVVDSSNLGQVSDQSEERRSIKVLENNQVSIRNFIIDQ